MQYNKPRWPDASSELLLSRGQQRQVSPARVRGFWLTQIYADVLYSLVAKSPFEGFCVAFDAATEAPRWREQEDSVIHVNRLREILVVLRQQQVKCTTTG